MQQYPRFAAVLWIVGLCLFTLAATAAEKRAAGIKPRPAVTVKQAAPQVKPEVAAPGKGSVAPTPMKRQTVPSPLPTLTRDGKATQSVVGPQREAPATLTLPPITGVPSQRKVETFDLKPGHQDFRQSIKGAFEPGRGAYDVFGRPRGYEEVMHDSDVPELNKWTKTERETTQYYDESGPSDGQQRGQQREQQNAYDEQGRTIDVHEEVWGSQDADKKTTITTYHTYNSLGQVAQELTYDHETGEVTDAGALRAQISALSDGDYDSTSTVWSGLRLLIRAINAEANPNAFSQRDHGSDLDATSTVYQPHRKLPTDLAKGVAARDVTATASSGAFSQLGHGSDADATSTVFQPRRVVLPRNLATGDSDLNVLITTTRNDTQYRSYGRADTYRHEINSDADETVAASQRLSTEYRETMLITDTDVDTNGHLVSFEFRDKNGSRHSVDGITYDEDGNASGFTFTHKQQGTMTSVTYPLDDD